MSHIAIELHSLIQSMTSYEKKSLTIQYNSTGNSMILFNALKNLKEYDEEKLKKYLQKNKKDNLAKNLAKEMTTLWRVILKGLNHTVDPKSIEDRLIRNFKDVKFLHERDCILKSRRMLKKLTKEAEIYDQKELLLQVYRFERKTRRYNYEYRYLNSIGEFNKKEIKLVEAIALEQKLRHIYDHVLYLTQKFGVLRKGSDNKLLVEMETALNKIDRKQCNCFSTEMLYLGSMEMLFQLKSDIDTAFKYMTELYQLYEKYTAIRENAGIKYIKFLTNYLNYFIRYDKPTDKFSEVVARIKSTKLSTPREKTLRFSDTSYIEFSYHLHHGDFTKMEKAIPSLIEGLEKYDDKMNLGRKTAIWYNIMIYYFLKEDFDSADFWIQKIQNDGNKSKRTDTLNKNKLFDLIVNYELGKIQKTDNSIRLESLIRTVKRNFKEADNSNELVNLVTQMMTAHCNKAHLSKKDFELALQKFENIDRTKNLYLPYDEIEIWLKSKVKRQPMQKIAEQMLRAE